MSAAQRKAVTHYRERLKRRGLVRLELLAPESDVTLIQKIVAALRGKPDEAARVRRRIGDVVGRERKPDLLQLLADDDSVVDFDEFLARDHDRGRDVDL